MPPGWSTRSALAACSDQLRDLFVQSGPVAVVVLAEDHQVHCQSVQAPIRVGL